jgi:uncharacterized membrane protein YjjP (DUF1212 family)
MWSVAHACGIRNVEVDVTFTTLTLSHQASVDEPALIQTRHVRHRDIDYEDLTLVDHLVRDLIGGVVDRDEARARLAQVVSSGHRLPRWAVTAGYGVMGAGVAMLLGGNLTVIVLAFLAAVAIDLLIRAMARRRLPGFYQQVAGGLLATLIAVTSAAVGLDVDPSLVVTTSIVMLLAGIGFMGAIQDALTGFPLTAGARILEAMLATAGIIAGVSGGLGLAATVGVDIPTISPGQVGIQEVGVAAFGAAVAAAAFAFSSYSPKRMLVPVALVAAVAMTISQTIQEPGLGRTWSVALAALFVGLVGYSLAGRLRVPPLILVVSAVVPMLPGLSIFRGLSLLAEGDRFNTSEGLVALMTAASVALALAAGVILGEYVAQPLKREARRVESRLAGPRLVGPVQVLGRRGRAGRRRRDSISEGQSD